MKRKIKIWTNPYTKWLLLGILSLFIGTFLYILHIDTDIELIRSIQECFAESPIPLFLTLNAGLFLFGIFSTRLSSLLNMPVLLLFLLAGMFIGSQYGLNIPNDPPTARVANWIGTIAMAFILYSGGLETDTKTLRRVFVPGTLLSTLGVILTALVLAIGAHYMMRWSWKWSLLLGCVISSTDAAAVFSVLRSKSVSLKGELAPVLEFESGSNDPMAALITIFMVGMLKNGGDVSWWRFPIDFLYKMGGGVIMGFIIGRVSSLLFNRAKLDYEGLYFVLGIATVLLSYGLTESLQCNGFMGVYVAGLTMSARRYNYKKSQLRFNNGTAWLMQMTMFTVLGMLVTPPDLRAKPEDWICPVWVVGVLLALVMMLVARPLAVFACLVHSKFNLRERLLISWVGLRGAAPIVLATFPLAVQSELQGNPGQHENATMLFNLVFCMVLASVLIQGRTLMPLAKLLKLDAPLREKPRSPLELEQTGVMNSVMHEFEIMENSPCVNKTLAELRFPSGVLVMLIRRGESFLLARGNTILELGDGVMVMGEEAQMQELCEKFFPGNDFTDD